MEGKVLALIGATFAVAACGGPEYGSIPQSEFQTAVVDEPDGRVSLYSGHLIADALARADDVESLSFMTSFLRVRVLRSLIEAVPLAPDQPVFISLEEASPGVEILLHEFDYASVRGGRATQMKNSAFIPADPWLTGHAQVLHDLSGALVGGVNIVKYSRSDTTLSSAHIIWGMTSCTGQAGCPQLLYDNPNPCLWPLPLPASWDATQTIDALCH